MGQFIIQEWAIQNLSAANGQEQRYADPLYVDTSHKFLISGHPWEMGAVSSGMYGQKLSTASQGTDLTIPLILRPWTDRLAVAVKAVLDDEDGYVHITLKDNPTVPPVTLSQFSDNDIKLTMEDLDVSAAFPATEIAWQSVEWTAVGNLAVDSATGDTKHMLQFSPVNAWQDVFCIIEISNAELHSIKFKQFSSADELT